MLATGGCYRLPLPKRKKHSNILLPIANSPGSMAAHRHIKRISREFESQNNTQECSTIFILLAANMILICNPGALPIFIEHIKPCAATLNAIGKIFSNTASSLSWRRRALLLRVNPKSLATTSTGHFSPNWEAIDLERLAFPEAHNVSAKVEVWFSKRYG